MPRGALSCALAGVAAAALCALSSPLSPVEAFFAAPSPPAGRRAAAANAAAACVPPLYAVDLAGEGEGDGDGDVGCGGVIGRREAFSRGGAAAAAAAFSAAFAFVPAPSAEAKESAAPPATPESVAAAFGAVRYQLESAETDGVPRLQYLVETENYPEIMEFTKLYDGAFRKGKMKPARKFLTDGKAKEDAQMLSNAVTFDLIGINKSSRPGQESREGAMKYLEELKADVNKFLDLEGTVSFD